jgi:CBS domain-containing protein
MSKPLQVIRVPLVSEASSSMPLAALDAVVLDTETTGLDARSARIIQIGAVLIQGAKILPDGRLDRLIDPGIPIPPATTLVHGITDQMVKGAPAFPAVFEELDNYLGNAIVIGHTIAFDLTILEREARLAGRQLRPRRSLDVRVLAELARPSLAHYDLDGIAAALEVPIHARHTATGDAMTTAGIFAALLPLLRAKGIRTLAEAEAASRALAERQASGSRWPLTELPAATERLSALSRVDTFTYTHRVRDVMSAPPVWCDPAAQIRAVIQLLLDRKVSSVLVKDADGTPGILTERDVLRALDRAGAPGPDAPASDFVSKPLRTIEESNHVYRAIGRMNRLGIRHLGVVDAAGAVTGVVTTRNLLRHRGSTAIAMGDAIDCAESERALCTAWASLPMVTRSLLAEGIGAHKISAVISAEICALTRRAAELAERRMAAAGQGAPPMPYAFLVLGSAGRGESLLAADQDNALVFADGESGGPADRWFEAFATHVAQVLDDVGVPFCKGGVMAKNSVWRHGVRGWHALIERWIGRQRPEDILNVDIFFDGVTVHGDRSLGDSIFAHAHQRARQSVTFQKQLTETARRWSNPVTVLGNLRTDANGRIDLKKYGLLPVFTAARVLAIRAGEHVRSTPERLRTAAAADQPNAGEIEALIEAHGVIMSAMIEQQLLDGELGIPLSPRVSLARLTKMRRAELKAAISKVATAIDLVSEGRV